MYKWLFAFLMLPLITPANAEDQIQATLLDHVSVVSQIADGETKVALVDSVVQIGFKDGRSVVDLQLGYSGNTRPEPDQASAANFIAGGYFKVSSLLQDKVHFPEHWKFLNSLEHGVAYSYDFREKRDFVSYQVGLAFALNPK